MILLIMHIFIFGTSCQSSDKDNISNGSLKKDPVILDSASILYHDFDLKKDCYDCGFSMTFFMKVNSDSLLKKLSDKDISASLVSPNTKDTFMLSIGDFQFDKVDILKLKITNKQVEHLACGYYEGVRFLYKISANGYLYFSDSARNENTLVKRSNDFTIHRMLW